MVHRKRKLMTYYSSYQPFKESWILAMLSRDSGHFSNFRRNRNKLIKYRQKVTFSGGQKSFCEKLL